MVRWEQECADEMGRIFGLSDLQMVPFYLKIGLDIGRVFAKCLIFDEFFLWLTYRLSNSTYASQFTWQKVLICFKKKPFRVHTPIQFPIPTRVKWGWENHSYLHYPIFNRSSLTFILQMRVRPLK